MSVRTRTMRRARAAALALLAAAGAAAAQDAATLEQQFREPTAAARPRVWWHWIDGNVTAEGITRDLEWMRRIGVAGFQLFDVGRGYPAYVEQPATFMSPQWLALVRHAAAEADRLGLEMTLASADGWSETGGPGVQPAAAMKKLVWSETALHGGRRYSGRLPLPPSANGPFQDLAMQPPFKIAGEPKWDQPVPRTPYYADARVVAYRETVREPARATARASAGAPDAALLRDGRFDRAFVLPVAPAQGENWLALDFGRPVTVRSLRLGMLWPEGKGSALPEGSVQAGDDGRHWRTLAPLPDPGSAAGLPVYTLALPETRARWFRVRVAPSKGFSLPGLPARSIEEFRFTEMDFAAAARPNRYEAKAGYATLRDYEAAATPDSGAAIDPASVVDLTSLLHADGTLDWTPPPGDWTVLRFGYSLTGAVNRPATAAGSGYEVDKYSAREVRGYLEGYYGPVLAALGPLSGARGLRAVLTDSWEAGQANWTPAMLDEFRARRGYDPTPWLPVLADRIVGSAAASDRFLWDFRRTLADLLAEAHYGTVAAFAREHGLDYYGEAMGVGLPTTGDGLQDKRYPTVPMAEFWQVPPELPSFPNHVADVREAASAAHVYGQNLVAAESFTSFPFPGTPAPYATTPRLLKPLADRFMALGVNRFVIHTAPHQPLERAPGFTLSMIGQYFSRHETWGEQARGWMDYLARSSQLLQQGRYAADIAYFYGEGAAVTVPDGAATDPAIPPGYGYDFVGRDMLLQDFRVQDGRLVAPSGVSYRLLVLPASTASLSLPLARKLRELVAQGAVLVGPRPLRAAGLADGDAALAAVAGELWGDLDGRMRTRRDYGRGRVYWGLPLADVLAAEDLAPDVRFEGEGAERMVTLHRHLPDGEIYFVANQGGAPVRLDARLRASGYEAELWRADDASIAPASFRQENGRTVVPLALGAYDAVFVVLRRPTTLAERAVAAPDERTLATLDGPWTLRFMPGRGAPDSVRLARLASWSESADPGIRYYAGTGGYETILDVPKRWLAGRPRLLLDLGEVHETAEVFVDGRSAGYAWKPPYRVDVGAYLKPGRNALRIAVANLWPNRFIGDRQPGATHRYAFSTYDDYWPGLARLPFDKDTPLLPSGLLGPVRLVAETQPWRNE